MNLQHTLKCISLQTENRVTHLSTFRLFFSKFNPNNFYSLLLLKLSFIKLIFVICSNSNTFKLTNLFNYLLEFVEQLFCLT
jgi:hypothetical protein